MSKDDKLNNISTDNLVDLPTGKPHISFSELSEWDSCSWRHKLRAIDKLALDETGWGAEFGTAIHDACENFLSTRIMNKKIAFDYIINSWKENKFEVKDQKGNPLTVKDFLKQANMILSAVPDFINKNFKNWKCIEAEHLLYEKLDQKDHAFKGFIDGVIEADGPRKKRLIWLIDWKTCGWGWTADQKGDKKKQRQLILYKNFYSQKTGINLKDIRCAFILLKRIAKPERCIEIVNVSVGNVTIDRSLNVINNMLGSVKNGMFLKNKEACKWCEFMRTAHCKNSGTGY